MRRPEQSLRAKVLALAAGGVVAGWSFVWWFTQPPSREEVANDLFINGELIAYEQVSGTPYVVFRDGARILFDNLAMDPLNMDFPPTPNWHLNGHWDSIGRVRSVASVGVSDHEPGLLFGQVRDPDITTMEVRYDGEWHRFEVSAPGYIVRMAEQDAEPSAFRWLDRNGRVVEELSRPYPLNRGS